MMPTVEEVVTEQIKKQGYAHISLLEINDRQAVDVSKELGLHCCYWVTSRMFEFRKQPFSVNPRDELREVLA
jgi:hypothetical protein